jgi:tight adherence protein C
MLFILFFVLAFLVLAGLMYSGLTLMTPQEDPLSDRLEGLQTSAQSAAFRASRRVGGGGFWNSFLYLVSSLGGESWINETDRELAQAGIRNKDATALYIFGHICFMLLMLGGMVYLQQMQGNDASQMFGGMVAAALLGYVIPPQVLHRLVRRYRDKLQDALPDTVDLLGIVLGTGLALDQAMLRVSEELQFTYPELAREFGIVVMQVRAGQERAQAFNRLVRRTGIEDLKSLAAMILQSERFGTSLSQALKVYADALRQRRRLRAEAAVAKAGIKMLFPIIIFILPVLFIITIVPGLAIAFKDLRNMNSGR